MFSFFKRKKKEVPKAPQSLHDLPVPHKKTENGSMDSIGDDTDLIRKFDPDISMDFSDPLSSFIIDNSSAIDDTPANQDFDFGGGDGGGGGAGGSWDNDSSSSDSGSGSSD
jgi:hypothetical protein